MHAATDAHYGQLHLENQMLDGLFATANIDSGVFDVQENRLDTGSADVGKLCLDASDNPVGNCLH